MVAPTGVGLYVAPVRKRGRILSARAFHISAILSETHTVTKYAPHDE